MADDDVRITFRISEDRKDRLESLLDVHNALADDDQKLTKSSLLRDCVEESITELEDKLEDEMDTLEDFIQGNANQATATAD